MKNIGEFYQSQVIRQSLQIAIEGLAVFHGMRFCLFEGRKQIEVESDVVNVINALNQNEVNLSMEGCIFDDIKELIPELQSCQIASGRFPGAIIELPIQLLRSRKSITFVEK